MYQINIVRNMKNWPTVNFFNDTIYNIWKRNEFQIPDNSNVNTNSLQINDSYCKIIRTRL